MDLIRACACAAYRCAGRAVVRIAERVVLSVVHVSQAHIRSST